MRKLFKLGQTGSRARILLLALLLFRAYVPIGFMPADGVPFALQLCPAAMAGMPAHLHHHAGTHAEFESCPFGSVPAAGPVSHHIDFQTAGPAPAQQTVGYAAPAFTDRLEHTHQPRGPPSLA
ncbi:MAG TPA: hypothetical protein VIY68_04730 [Steroidobacteraceae bacterium]